MKINATNFIQRFNEEPLLLAPGAAAYIEHLIRDSEQPKGEVPYDEMCAAAYGFPVSDRNKPFVFSEGVAFIPVHGVLLHKYNYSSEYATGYEYIRSRFDAALVDPQVKGIVFDVNSPGGQVAGNFELSDHIYANRGKKPMMAMVDTMAYSGGYSLGSSVGKMVATPSGGAGSIGVVMMHVSVARALETFGVDVTMIYAGKHKIDGSPFKELSESAQKRFQASVDRSYDQFVSLVARNRGLESDAVKATEALTYDASEAVKVGLVDAVQEPVSALAAFRKELSGSTTFTGGNAMSTATKPEAAANAASETITETEDKPTVTTVDQKARISTILSCEESQGRRKLAEHIAFNTDMSEDDAKKMLAASEKEQPEAKGGDGAFKKAMDEGKHPNMDAGGEGSGGGDIVEESAGDRIAKAYKASKGA